MTDEAVVVIERQGPIAWVRLNRPRQRNALNLQLCLDLRAAFAELDGDENIRAVLVEGAGPVFCAGADLKERQGKDAEWVRQRRLASFAAYDAIERCSKPVIALVHNGVIGSGGEIAMACDFIIASSDAFFTFPETKWGTVGATQRLQRAIGKRTAKELLFTGRSMPVDEARLLGLVSRIVEPAALREAGEQAARQITDAPALAVRLTKQSVDLGGRTDQDSGIRIEQAAIEYNLAVGDWQGGIDKFIEKSSKKS